MVENLLAVLGNMASIWSFLANVKFGKWLPASIFALFLFVVSFGGGYLSSDSEDPETYYASLVSSVFPSFVQAGPEARQTDEETTQSDQAVTESAIHKSKAVALQQEARKARDLVENAQMMQERVLLTTGLGLLAKGRSDAPFLYEQAQDIRKRYLVLDSYPLDGSEESNNREREMRKLVREMKGILTSFADMYGT